MLLLSRVSDHPPAREEKYLLFSLGRDWDQGEMKFSLNKLRGLTTHHRTESKNKMDRCNNPAQLAELEQASQDLQEMRDCYDSLLSAAAATTNSAYEFSEALREMGDCLLERNAMNDDEDIGIVLLRLGKVQFELQKLVDSYRSHIVQTITTPSESFLNELRTVEDMKKQSDEKRLILEHMLASQKEKGKSKYAKGETFSPEQIQSAQEEYDEQLDPMEHTSLPVLTPETLQEDLEKGQGNMLTLSKPRLSGQSAPFYSEKTFDLADKADTQPSLTRKFRTYVLPTPLDCKGSNSLSSCSTPVTHLKSLGRWSHSSPMVPDKNSADSRDHNLFPEHSMKAQSVPKESDINSKTRVPPPLAEGLLCHGLDNKKKRCTFSGPLTSKAWSGKPFFPMPQEHTPEVSTLHMKLPTSKASTSPKVSPCTSSLVMSSTRTSELHELPRPPQAKPTRPPSLVGHSAPLFSRGLEIPATTKSLPVSSLVASPLPIPPGTMLRSFSIPSPGQRTKYATVGKLFEAHSLNVAGRLSSHSVLPISLSNFLPTPSNSGMYAQTARVKVLS